MAIGQLQPRHFWYFRNSVSVSGIPGIRHKSYMNASCSLDYSSPLPLWTACKKRRCGPSQYRTTFPLLHPAPRPYSRCMWKTRLAIIAVVGGILAGLALLFYVVWPVLRSQAPPRIVNTPNLVLQVQGLSQLVTVKYVMEKVVKLESE